jgi:hypothetical protein
MNNHTEDHTGGNSSVVHSCIESSEDDTDTDLELDQWSSRRSNELFREPLGLTKTRSPVVSTSNEESMGESSAPIFKRIVSKSTLKPQLKAFRRITSELQYERVPLENEINYEKLVLLNLEDEAHYMNSTQMKKNDKTIEQNNSSYKKFDIIKKANESWNMKKNGDQQQQHSDIATPESRRKRSFDHDCKNKFKRRAVSTSPISAGLFRRRNIKLLSKAAEDLESMTLDN